MPCVAVLIAPASDCMLMSGSFCRFCPTPASSPPAIMIRVPPPSVARSVAASCETRPAIGSSETSVPFDGTTGLNEWPPPKARIGVFAVFTMLTSSASLAG